MQRQNEGIGEQPASPTAWDYGTVRYGITTVQTILYSGRSKFCVICASTENLQSIYSVQSILEYSTLGISSSYGCRPPPTQDEHRHLTMVVKRREALVS